MSTNAAEPKASAHSSPHDETVVMPVVKPLAEKPAQDTTCEHVAYTPMGSTLGPDQVKRYLKCDDCGHRWSVLEDLPPEAESEQPGKPPKAVYGHAQVVTYQTAKGQYDLVVGELAMVSTQNGLIVVQHHDAPVVGIVGVRPWLEEERDAADAEG